MRRSTRSRSAGSERRGCFVSSTVALLAGLSLLLAPGFAGAEDAEEAKRHFEKAELAYKLGRYSEAIDAYEAAYKALPEPAFLFNVAQAHRQQYQIDKKALHLHKALSLYKAYLRDAPEAKNRQVVIRLVDELKSLLTDIESRNESAGKPGMLVLHADPSAVGARLRLDAQPVGALPLSREVPAGTHTLEATREGFRPWSSTVTVASGSRLELSVALQPLAGEPSRTQPASTPIYKRWWFWTLIGAVAAGAAGTGIYFGTRGEPASPMPQIDLR